MQGTTQRVSQHPGDGVMSARLRWSNEVGDVTNRAREVIIHEISTSADETDDPAPPIGLFDVGIIFGDACVNRTCRGVSAQNPGTARPLTADDVISHVRSPATNFAQTYPRPLSDAGRLRGISHRDPPRRPHQVHWLAQHQRPWPGLSLGLRCRDHPPSHPMRQARCR